MGRRRNGNFRAEIGRVGDACGHGVKDAEIEIGVKRCSNQCCSV